jgi:hydrogenase expression/formation protein HypC
MCLAIPAQVIDIEGDGQFASVALGNVKKRISVSLLDEVHIGDFVLVHVGYALNRVSPEEAEHTLSLMREAGLVDSAGESA